MKGLHIVTFTLLVVGGLNWLLVGVFDFDLVSSIFGSMTVISRTIYILVGVSAIVELFTHKGNCRLCSSSQA